LVVLLTVARDEEMFSVIISEKGGAERRDAVDRT